MLDFNLDDLTPKHAFQPLDSIILMTYVLLLPIMLN